MDSTQSGWLQLYPRYVSWQDFRVCSSLEHSTPFPFPWSQFIHAHLQVCCCHSDEIRASWGGFVQRNRGSFRSIELIKQCKSSTQTLIRWKRDTPSYLRRKNDEYCRELLLAGLNLAQFLSDPKGMIDQQHIPKVLSTAVLGNSNGFVDTIALV